MPKRRKAKKGKKSPTYWIARLREAGWWYSDESAPIGGWHGPWDDPYGRVVHPGMAWQEAVGKAFDEYEYRGYVDIYEPAQRRMYANPRKKTTNNRATKPSAKKRRLTREEAMLKLRAIKKRKPKKRKRKVRPKY